MPPDKAFVTPVSPLPPSAASQLCGDSPGTRLEISRQRRGCPPAQQSQEQSQASACPLPKPLQGTQGTQVTQMTPTRAGSGSFLSIKPPERGVYLHKTPGEGSLTLPCPRSSTSPPLPSLLGMCWVPDSCQGDFPIWESSWILPGSEQGSAGSSGMDLPARIPGMSQPRCSWLSRDGFSSWDPWNEPTRPCPGSRSHPACSDHPALLLSPLPILPRSGSTNPPKTPQNEGSHIERRQQSVGAGRDTGRAAEGGEVAAPGKSEGRDEPFRGSRISIFPLPENRSPLRVRIPNVIAAGSLPGQARTCVSSRPWRAQGPCWLRVSGLCLLFPLSSSSAPHASKAQL